MPQPKAFFSILQGFQPYTHLILLVTPPEGSFETDTVLRNNFEGAEIRISNFNITTSKAPNKNYFIFLPLVAENLMILSIYADHKKEICISTI